MPRASRERPWERRFIADPVRAAEMTELYARAGYEVKAEPATEQDFSPGCDACALAKSGLFKVIYTRPRRSPS